MICAYLLHRDRCKDADEVLSFYGQARTHNAKVGTAAGLPVRCAVLFISITQSDTAHYFVDVL